MEVFFNDLKRQFILNFIEKDRWKLMVTGLENTLKITIVAAIIGIFIGILLASIRSTYDKQYETLKKHKGVKYYVLSFLNFIAQVYLTVIRGTPVVVQLLIAFFIILPRRKTVLPLRGWRLELTQALMWRKYSAVASWLSITVSLKPDIPWALTIFKR